MQNLGLYYIYVFISGIFYGLSIFGGKVLSNMGLSWFEVVTLPSVCIALIVLPFVISEVKLFFASKAPLLIMILFPLGINMSQIGQMTPLFLGLSVSMTVLLVYTMPIWTILINYFFLKQKATLMEIMLAILIIIGVVILVNPWVDMKFSIIGAAFAVSAGLGSSLWLIISTYFSRNNTKPLTLTFITSICVFIPISLMFPFLHLFIKDPSMLTFSLDKPLSTWIVIIIYPLLAFTLSNLLFFKGAQKVPSIHSSLILLLEPVSAVLLDVCFLGTRLTWNIIVGGLLIIAANLFLIIKGANNEQTLKN